MKYTVVAAVTAGWQSVAGLYYACTEEGGMDVLWWGQRCSLNPGFCTVDSSALAFNQRWKLPNDLKPFLDLISMGYFNLRGEGWCWLHTRLDTACFY